MKIRKPEKKALIIITNQEAADFDIPAFITAQPASHHIHLFGHRKNFKDVIGYQFDSRRLDNSAPCKELCEKVVKIERVPYMGLAVEPMDDFSGVRIENIMAGGSAENSMLEIGDIITSMQAVDISNPCNLTTVISDQSVDGTVEVEFIRDGKPLRDYFTVGSRVKKTISWVNCCQPEVIPVATTIQSMGLHVFPNPTADLAQFEFSSNSLSTVALQVTDITGMVLFEKKLIPVDGGARDYFDFGGLASGIYLVRVEQDGQQLVERVAVQRK